MRNDVADEDGYILGGLLKTSSESEILVVHKFVTHHEMRLC